MWYTLQRATVPRLLGPYAVQTLKPRLLVGHFRERHKVRVVDECSSGKDGMAVMEEGAIPAVVDDSQPPKSTGPVDKGSSESCEDILEALYAADAAGKKEVVEVPQEPTAPSPMSAQKPRFVGRDQAQASAPHPSSRAPPTFVHKGDPLTDLGVFSNAVLLIDKEETWTSFDVCNKLKGVLKQLKISKVGHAGTLDPFATGLLIICTGSATKCIESFMGQRKTYSGVMRLGEGTPSQDKDTPVEQHLPWEHLTDTQLKEAAEKLTGTIQQVPPMYSAVHKDGKRLYELARQGVTVERAARPVEVYQYKVWRTAPGSQDVHFLIECGKGTYVRTLAYDLATSLGSVAHVTVLRREAIGENHVKDAWDVNILAKEMIERKKELRSK